MTKNMLVALAAATVAIGAGGSAIAQERMVVEETIIEDDPVGVVDDEADVVVTRRERVYPRVRAYRPAAPVARDRYYEPPVYGWMQDRPLNCGTYHYWNGDVCVDARNRED